MNMTDALTDKDTDQLIEGLKRLIVDKVTVDQISDLLNEQEWDADTLEEVARLVRMTGRKIGDSGDDIVRADQQEQLRKFSPPEEVDKFLVYRMGKSYEGDTDVQTCATEEDAIRAIEVLEDSHRRMGRYHAITYRVQYTYRINPDWSDK